MKKQELIEKICNAALDKKADNVVIMDIHEMTVIADSFIICSASSHSQVKAICDNIEEQMKKAGEDAVKIDGYNEARWVVMDYADVLVHVFYQEDREFYNLERLWNNGSNMMVFADKN